MLLRYADADIDTRLIPGKSDVSQLFTDLEEVGVNPADPARPLDQLLNLRNIRNSFTASEDNLVLRGVVSVFAVLLSLHSGTNPSFAISLISLADLFLLQTL